MSDETTIEVPGRMKGCHPSDPIVHARAMFLAPHLADLPPPPKEYDCYKGFRSFKMFLNDQLGDCVVARFCNSILGLSYATTGAAVTINDSDVRANYFAQTGGSDSGLNLADALSYWNQNGLIDAAGALHKPGVYGSIPNDLGIFDVANYYFQGLDIAIATPRSFMQSNDGDVVDWNSHMSPGGIDHCVGIGEKNADGNYELITWAGVRWATPRFVTACVGERWATPLTMDRLAPNGESIDGFDLAELQRQFAIFQGKPLTQ